jgi:hypothetical protein
MPAGHTDHDHLLEQLLEICENFFGHTSQATRDEVDAYLRARGITGGPSWLIDMLGLTRLQHQRYNSEPGTQTDA